MVKITITGIILFLAVTAVLIPVWLWLLIYLTAGCLLYCLLDSLTDEPGYKLKEAGTNFILYVYLSLGGLTLLWPLGLLLYIITNKDKVSSSYK